MLETDTLNAIAGSGCCDYLYKALGWRSAWSIGLLHTYGFPRAAAWYDLAAICHDCTAIWLI